MEELTFEFKNVITDEDVENTKQKLAELEEVKTAKVVFVSAGSMRFDLLVKQYSKLSSVLKDDTEVGFFTGSDSKMKDEEFILYLVVNCGNDKVNPKASEHPNVIYVSKDTLTKLGL